MLAPASHQLLQLVGVRDARQHLHDASALGCRAEAHDVELARLLDPGRPVQGAVGLLAPPQPDIELVEPLIAQQLKVLMEEFVDPPPGGSCSSDRHSGSRTRSPPDSPSGVLHVGIDVALCRDTQLLTEAIEIRLEALHPAEEVDRLLTVTDGSSSARGTAESCCCAERLWT